MLLTKEIEVIWNKNNKKYFIEKGYCFTEIGKSFIVKIEDLKKGSNKKVEVLCDYCLENGINTIITKKYNVFIRQNENSIIKKDCCKKCVYIKRKESNLLTYGVETVLELRSVRDKIENTFLNKYGYTNPFFDKKVQQKIKEGWKKEYGVSNPSQVDFINKKRKETFIDRFGFDNPSSNQEVKKKREKTFVERYGIRYIFESEEFKKETINKLIQKYGVDNIFKHPETKEIILKKTLISKYIKGNAPSSRQQKYLCNLLNGELNYPVHKMWLDIAFPDEMIYVEYDGGFHNGAVKLHDMIEDDFNKKEIIRYYILKQFKWNMIRVISNKDKLPQDIKILEMIDYAKQYLNSGHSWIKFDIDNSKMINSQGEFDYDYGELRKITKKFF